MITDDCIYRPPEALPAPKQGEYPTGLCLTTPIDIELCEPNRSAQFIFSGDLSPEKPAEYDELMADLTEDELKAAFRLKSYFFNIDVSAMISLDLYSATVKVLEITKKSISNLEQCPVLSQAF